MIADKIERIGIQYNRLKDINTLNRWKKGIKDPKNRLVREHRREEMTALKKMCKEEKVSFEALKNILK